MVSGWYRIGPEAAYRASSCNSLERFKSSISVSKLVSSFAGGSATAASTALASMPAAINREIHLGLIVVSWVAALTWPLPPRRNPVRNRFIRLRIIWQKRSAASFRKRRVRASPHTVRFSLALDRVPVARTVRVSHPVGARLVDVVVVALVCVVGVVAPGVRQDLSVAVAVIGRVAHQAVAVFGHVVREAASIAVIGVAVVIDGRVVVRHGAALLVGNLVGRVVVGCVAAGRHAAGRGILVGEVGEAARKQAAGDLLIVHRNDLRVLHVLRDHVIEAGLHLGVLASGPLVVHSGDVHPGEVLGGG